MTVDPQESIGLTLRERRQLRTRQELAGAALDVIAELGVESTTIERVTAASGISRGTVYAHFPGGRDELLRAAYERLGYQLVERTRVAVSAIAKAEDWRGRLKAHVVEMLALAADERLGHFFNVSGPALISVGSERGIGSGASVAMISEDLADAQLRGDVAVDVDAMATALLLVGALREAGIRVAAGDLERDRAIVTFERLIGGLGS